MTEHPDDASRRAGGVPDTAPPLGVATADGGPESPDPRQKEGTALPPFFSLVFSTRGVALAVNTIVMMQLTFYSTDTLGLPAALVGTLFLVSKVFDAFTDLAIGVLIDRTKSRWGKARPYELFIVPIWLLTIAIFSTPEMNTFWQATYIFVLFTLISAVCQTALNGCEAVYLKRAVHGEERYAKVLGRQGLFITLAAGGANVLLPQLIANWGNEPGGWTLISVLYGVPMMVLGLVRFLVIKELPVDGTKGLEERPSVRDILVAALSNKYAFLLAAIVLVANIVVHSGSIVGTYYFKYILGDIGLLSFGALGTLIVPFTFLLFSLAVRRIGGIGFVRIGLVVAIIGHAIVYLFPRVPAAVIGGHLMGSMASIITMLVGFFVIQTMVYSEWKTGKRIEAAANSVVGFCGKVGAGLAPALVGAVMGLVAYDGTAQSQTPAAESAIIALYSLGPLALCLVMFVLTFFYDLDRHMGKLNADLADGVHADTSDLKL
ncbi:MFS transporter [Nocardiopsis synnemataformans]|uniref:MFS transporter n=1 Tax=Nocardiopsis synnemataformans TaxID=61305 RepID=UPI003EBFB454